MIFTDRTIMVQKGTSSINDTIILYRGDKGIEIRFTLNEGSPFKFGSGSSPNIIEKTEATYGQLVIKTPGALPPIFSEVAPTIGGKIIFTITAEMIDEITEVGNYTFQIRLFDESMNSRATIPEVVNGIEIREPIATEDTTNEVGVATVGYALTTAGATEDAFDSQGNYNKTTWATGDRITDTKLNKIEDSIDEVNRKVANVNNINDTTANTTTTYSSNKIETIKRGLDSQIKDIANYADSTLTLKGAIDLFKTKLEKKEQLHFFMVGDSTRESNGAYVFNVISNTLSKYNVTCTLQAKSGLKMEHWCEINGDIQSEFPKVTQLISQIPDDGSNCFIDITGGINDTSSHTGQEIANYIKIGINKILESKPNCKIWVTSPNRYFYEPGNDKLKIAYEILKKDYDCIDVFNSLFKEWNDDIQSTYFVDNTHPNELGQRKIAHYELSKIIPMSLFPENNDLDSYFIPLKGHIDVKDANYELLKQSGFRVELKPTISNSINDLYLMKNASGNYYLYSEKSGKSISNYIVPKNGYQSVNKPSWGTVDFECNVYIENCDILKNFSDTSSYIHISNGVVSELSTENNIKNLVLNSYSNDSECKFTSEYENKLNRFSVYEVTSTAITVPTIPANSAINFDIEVSGVKPTSCVNLSFLWGVLSNKDFIVNANPTGSNKITVTIRNFGSSDKSPFDANVKILIIN